MNIEKLIKQIQQAETEQDFEKIFKTKITKINTELKSISKSFTPVTKTALYEQKYNTIIKSTGKFEGTIRSYSEYMDNLKSSPLFNEKDFNVQDYKETLLDLVQNAGDRLTYEGEFTRQDNYMRDYIEDKLGYAREALSGLSTEDLLEIFRQAEQAEREAGYKGSYDSKTRWYEDLEYYLQEKLSEI